MGDVLGGTYIQWLSTRVIVLGEQQKEKQLSFLLLFGNRNSPFYCEFRFLFYYNRPEGYFPNSACAQSSVPRCPEVAPPSDPGQPRAGPVTYQVVDEAYPK
jgi:hypothetical protein